MVALSCRIHVVLSLESLPIFRSLVIDIIFFGYFDVLSFEVIRNFKKGYLTRKVFDIFEVVMKSCLVSPLLLLQLQLNNIYL